MAEGKFRSQITVKCEVITVLLPSFHKVDFSDGSIIKEVNVVAQHTPVTRGSLQGLGLPIQYFYLVCRFAAKFQESDVFPIFPCIPKNGTNAGVK